MAETFDLEAVYDEQIAPLMAQIIDICTKHQMPYIASFFYGADKEGEYQCTSMLNPKVRDQERIEAARRALMSQGGLMAFAIHHEGKAP